MSKTSEISECHHERYDKYEVKCCYCGVSVCRQTGCSNMRRPYFSRSWCNKCWLITRHKSDTC